MSHLDTPPKEKESSWSSRLPLANTPLPSFRPNMSGLRTALLGYLGEVERAIQGQEEQQQQQYVEEPKEFGGTSSESTGLSSDEMDEEGRSTAIASGSKDGLRQRAALGVTGNGPAPIGNPTALQETNRSLLNHLSALREDVRSYLQPKLSVPPISYPSMPNRDWLRSLPSKLSVVDIGVDSPLSPEAKGKGRMPDFDTGAVENARKRVLETVRTLLPSEEWAGWERLGWEDQEDDGESPFRGRRRAASASIHRNPTYGEEEEEEDEPEYLFPNRTPASQQAMARAARRQAIRSTSFNGALHAREDRIVETSPIRPGFISAPMTRRTTGLPSFGQVALESEDDLDATAVHDQLEIEEMKQLLEQELEDVGPSIAEALQRAEDGNKLITYDDLPFWWRNNEHIITGYRFIPLHAKTGPIPLIKSAFTWHNETVNIHSHFIPTLLISAAIPLVLWASPLTDPHPLDTYIIALYLLAAVACLSSSASWHVLSGCASKKWFEWGACVDYIGIAWLIAASFGTVAYNGFYCQPKTVMLYCGTNALCGALGSYLPFQKWFNERRNKNARIAFFLFLNFAMIAPMVQLFYQHGYEKGSRFVAPFGLSVITYVIGLLFYAFHVPECFYPGKFDTWGHSHQVWHAAIVVAIILHYRATFVAHQSRYEYSCAMPDAGQTVGEAWDDLWANTWKAVGGK